jgi:hypothetical protein
VLVSLVLTGVVLAMFIAGPGINCSDKAMFGDMVYGRADRPFVYRALLPGTVRAVSSVVPSQTRDFVNRSIAGSPLVGPLFHGLGWEEEYWTEFVIALALLYGSLLGFLFAMRYFLRGVLLTPAWFADAVSLAAVVVLPPFFRHYGYIYDFPLLLLFTAGLGFMVRQRWWPFLVVFLLGCINKETTILLTMLFVLHFRKHDSMERPVFWKLVAAQLTIFAVVKLALSLAFRGNPGAFVEFHLIDHNLAILRSYSLSTPLLWLGVGLLVFFRWSEKPKFLRRGVWIPVVLLVFALFLGYIDELRGYYEALPVLLLLVAQSIAAVVGVELTPLARTTGGAVRTAATA